MSAGGVFKLLASDGRSDRMIHATDLLNARIRDIMCARKSMNMPDVTPTLADIEKTHILFINSHYKPFAAIAYEYNKVRAQSGTVTWGGQVLFSIPAYGEFFSDMVARISLGAVACTQSVVPPFPTAITAVPSLIPIAGTQKSIANATPLANQCTIYTQEYVDASGARVVPGTPTANFVRYCEYPGEMLFKEVKFEINGNPLDTYTREATMFYRKFWILHDKEVGWKRLVGQEVPVEGFTSASAIAGANAFTAPIAGLADMTGAEVGPADATITARKLIQVVSGPQTPKAMQPPLDLWIPLLFWFNKDIRLAIPSVSIPYGQRFITVTIEAQDNVVYRAPGNLFLKLTTEVLTDSAGVGTGTEAAVGVLNVARQVNFEPVLVAGSVINPAQTLFAELYVNNIFVNPEIHDIYIRRVGFTLVRVHRLQKQQVTVSNDNVLLSQLKWPTELIYVGMLPSYNIDATNPNKYRDWHNLTRVNDEVMYQTARSTGTVGTDLAEAWNAAANVVSFSHVETSEQLTVPVYAQTIDTLKVTVQGNDIIDTSTAPFFRDYTPWYYGQNIMRTPIDLGALLINFCVYPGLYQPSGHINISRAREFYVNYTSSYCSPANPCEFVALGIALNFLLISDGSAVLRFTS
ncbi:MAG: hypothetical protein M0R66_07070 [Candidatus Omnitrophica bacterium]|nr:hypothetical protein [Candidatus Omnitrophota bacterium]